MLEFISCEALADLATFQNHLRAPLAEVGVLPAACFRSGAGSIPVPTLSIADRLGLAGSSTTGECREDLPHPPIRMSWIVQPLRRPVESLDGSHFTVNHHLPFVFPRNSRLELLETIVRLTAAIKQQAGWFISHAFAGQHSLILEVCADQTSLELTLYHGPADTPLWGAITRAQNQAAATAAQNMLFSLCARAQ
jgi:hypothetical protein